MSFPKLLDKATSSENLDSDWESILQICDRIRMKEPQAKKAFQQIKKKLHDRNPHVQYYALTVLEACVKNCGTPVHDEVATRAFMEELRELVKAGAPPIVKNKVLELVQAWNHGFKNEPSYRVVTDTYNAMRMEGFQFPELKETDAMFNTEKPPEWDEDSSVSSCHLCHSNFGVLTRKHHCRNCGHIFCGSCSSHDSLIPRFGYEEPVRVCDTCYNQLSTGTGATSTPQPSSGGGDDLPIEYLQSSLARESQAPPARNQREMQLQEEEELQIALAMSLNEEENKKPYKPSSSSSNTRTTAPVSQPAPQRVHQPEPAPISEAVPSFEDNPEIARYMNMARENERRRQQQSMTNTPTVATVAAPPPAATMVAAPPPVDAVDGNDLTALKSTLQSSLDMFVDRMQTVSSQGRSIVLDQSVQSLFQSLSAMHPPLLSAMEELDQRRGHYTGLEERLQEAKEARISLNAMRREHQEKVRQQQAEMEILARIQMQQKLELLRQQKSEQAQHLEELQRNRHTAFQQQVQQQHQVQYQQQLEAQQLQLMKQQQLLQEQQMQIQAMATALPATQWPAAAAQLPVAVDQPAQLPPHHPAPVEQSYIPASVPAPASSMTAPLPTMGAAPPTMTGPPPAMSTPGIAPGAQQMPPPQYTQPVPAPQYAAQPPPQYIAQGPVPTQPGYQPKNEQLISFD